MIAEATHADLFAQGQYDANWDDFPEVCVTDPIESWR
jgi:hypothetical protein